MTSSVDILAARAVLASAWAKADATIKEYADVMAFLEGQAPVVTPPVVVPPVVVPPVSTTLTSYPKRTEVGTKVGASTPTVVYKEGDTVPGFGKVTNGALMLPAGNVDLGANWGIKGAIISPGGVVTGKNIRQEGGYGSESYWRILGQGAFNLTSCSSIRTGDAGLGSSISHGYFAGNGAHTLVQCYAEGSQTGFALGGGPDAAHPRALIGCAVAKQRQVGTGHCEGEFIGIAGGGYFLTDMCHWEPGGHAGWQTAAAFMQPSSAESWWTLKRSFLAGQNINLYIQSAYQQTASSWLPAAPPAGHPGHLYASDVDFGPQTSPSQSWNTWWKNGFGKFETFTNCREVDVNYAPTGFVLPVPPAGFVEGDSSYLRKPASRTD